MASHGLPWGHVRHNGVEASKIHRGDQQPRVVRTLEVYAKYTVPPPALAAALAALDVCFWEKHQGEEKHHEMHWPSEAEQAKTLRSLAMELQKCRGSQQHLPADEPLLGELNRVIDRLLQAVVTLHAQGWGVGLLTPMNVLYVLKNDRLTMTFADLGFQQDPAKNSVPGFLKACEPYRDLWQPYSLLEQHQAAPPTIGLPTPARTSAPLAADRQRHEVRVLARLIASVLAGGRPFRGLDDRKPAGSVGDSWFVSLEMPPLDLAPDTRADVWHVLSEAMAGRIATVAELRRGLTEYPPSLACLAPPVKPRRLGTWLARAALVGALVVAVSGVYGAKDWRPGDPLPVAAQATAPGPLPADHPYVALLAQADEVKRNPANWATLFVVLLSMNDVPRAEEPGLRQTEEHHRERVRSEIPALVHKLIDRAEEDLGEPGRIRFAAEDRLEELQRRLEALKQLEPCSEKLQQEEKQCRERLGQLLRGRPS